MAEQQSAALHHQTERRLTTSCGDAGSPNKERAAPPALLLQWASFQTARSPKRWLVSISAADLPLGTGEHAVQRSALDAALRRVDGHRARLRGSERVSKLLQRCALGGGSGGGCGGGGAGGDGVGCGAGGGGAGGGAGDRARRCAVAGTRGEAGIANSRFHRNDASRVSTESGMGRRPKTFGIGFGFVSCPHQKLEKVTDVTVV